MEQNANVLGAGLFALDRDALAALAQSLCRQLTERGAYHGGIRPEIWAATAGVKSPWESPWATM